jgi:hypothetical protein
MACASLLERRRNDSHFCELTDTPISTELALYLAIVIPAPERTERPLFARSVVTVGRVGIWHDQFQNAPTDSARAVP